MPGGRPKIELTDKEWEQLDRMIQIFCTGEEIAGILSMDYDTLASRVKEKHGVSFSEYIKEKQSGGKMSLRRKQYEIALTGDKTMLIWLGKQFLGQSDKQENKTELSGKKLIIDFGDDE